MRTKRVLVIGAVISALLVTAAGTAQAGGTDPTANSTNPSIVDGRLVDSAPWAVQVRRNGGFTCSGSIFAANWVLTAAHCIGGASPSAISFLIGDVRLGQGTSARAKAMHTRNDLAVIELDRNVTTTYVKLAATNPPIGARADIYGWGVTCSGGGCGLSRQLKTATNRIASVRGDKLSHETLDGYAESGDSGGPSIYNGEQVGELCCGGTRYNDYTSIPTHIAWIRQVTGIGSVNPTTDAA